MNRSRLRVVTGACGFTAGAISASFVRTFHEEQPETKRGAGFSPAPSSFGGTSFSVAGCQRRIVREDRFKSPRFLLIVQHNNRYYTEPLFAGMALRDFALQILQETVNEMIVSPLAPGIFLIPRAAVRTGKFNFVLLRIAVQSCPAGAAHTNRFCIAPFHGDCLLEIHVHLHGCAKGPTRYTFSHNLRQLSGLGTRAAKHRKPAGTCAECRCQTQGGRAHLTSLRAAAPATARQPAEAGAANLTCARGILMRGV